jgi:hypothetical protein
MYGHNFWHDSSFHTDALSPHLLPTYNPGSPTIGATSLDLTSTDDVPGSEIPASAKALSMLANKAIGNTGCTRVLGAPDWRLDSLDSLSLATGDNHIRMHRKLLYNIVISELLP